MQTQVQSNNTTAYNETCFDVIEKVSHQDAEQQKEAALGEDVYVKKQPEWFSSDNFAAIMRWGGGIVIAASAISFMLQGVYSMSPLTRHWVFLAIALLFGILGLITATILKEHKGSRSFLGIAVAAFPVLCSQLGAMYFSVFGSPPDPMPQPLVFTSVTFATVAAISLVTLAVFLPICYFGFKVFAGPRAKLLTGIYVLSNCGLLIPVRHGIGLAAVLLCVSLALHLIDTYNFSLDFRLKNFEGYVSRVLPAIPLAILVARSTYYDTGPFFKAVLFGMFGAYLSFHCGRIARKVAVLRFFQAAGMSGLILGWGFFAFPVLGDINAGVRGGIMLLVIPWALIIGAHALIGRGVAPATYVNTAAVVACSGLVFLHLIDSAPVNSLVSLALAACIIAVGILNGQKVAFMLGCTVSLLCIVNVSVKVIDMHGSFAWIGLAVIGMLVLLLASLAEKSKELVHERMLAFWNRMSM
ncbi:MAG: hypothetical protein GF398_05775 [Chitinivibrionales bacterium]|nr:hypothetical protein [Chitinivibrionales bacterium]